MTTADHVSPVRVHIESANEGVMTPAPGRRLLNAVTLTKNMSSTTANGLGPVIDLVPYDTARLYILVQAGGSNIVICTDLSQAQDPANQVAGVPNPNGYLLSAGNTKPVKIEGCQRMWAVANTFPSQVTWIAIHEQVTR